MDPYTAWTAERLAPLGTTRLSQLRNRPRLGTQGPPARPAPHQPSARPKPPPPSRSSSLTHLSAPELRASRPRSSLNSHRRLRRPLNLPLNTRRPASYPAPHSPLYSAQPDPPKFQLLSAPASDVRRTPSRACTDWLLQSSGRKRPQGGGEKVTAAFSNRIGSRDRRPLGWGGRRTSGRWRPRLLRLSVLASGSRCVFLCPDTFRDWLCHPILSLVFSSCEVEGNSWCRQAYIEAQTAEPIANFPPALTDCRWLRCLYTDVADYFF